MQCCLLVGLQVEANEGKIHKYFEARYFDIYYKGAFLRLLKVFKAPTLSTKNTHTDREAHIHFTWFRNVFVEVDSFVYGMTVLREAKGIKLAILSTV